MEDSVGGRLKRLEEVIDGLMKVRTNATNKFNHLCNAASLEIKKRDCEDENRRDTTLEDSNIEPQHRSRGGYADLKAFLKDKPRWELLLTQ